MGRQRTQCGLRRVGDDTRVGSGPSTSDRQRGQHICWQLGIIRLHDFVECRQAVTQGHRRPVDPGADAGAFAKMTQVPQQPVGQVDRRLGMAQQRAAQFDPRLRAFQPETGGVIGRQFPSRLALAHREGSRTQRTRYP